MWLRATIVMSIIAASWGCEFDDSAHAETSTRKAVESATTRATRLPSASSQLTNTRSVARCSLLTPPFVNSNGFIIRRDGAIWTIFRVSCLVSCEPMIAVVNAGRPPSYQPMMSGYDSEPVPYPEGIHVVGDAYGPAWPTKELAMNAIDKNLVSLLATDVLVRLPELPCDDMLYYDPLR